MKRFSALGLMFAAIAGIAVYLSTYPACACLDLFPRRIYDLNALNPIRDQRPELAAEQFLRNQGQSLCDPAHSPLCDYALASRRVLDWRLVARQNSLNEVVLFYRVKGRDSSNGREFWGQAGIDLRRDKAAWTVTGYTALY